MRASHEQPGPETKTAVTEREVCERLGVSREDLRAFRVASLEQHVDWVLLRGEVTYTEDGMKKMGKNFGLGIVDCGLKKNAAWDGVKNAPEARDGSGQGPEDKSGATGAVVSGAVNLTVVRMCPNPIFVDCAWRKAESGKQKAEMERVVVRVRNNRRLRPGMVLAGCTKNAAGCWIYAGRL